MAFILARSIPIPDHLPKRRCTCVGEMEEKGDRRMTAPIHQILIIVYRKNHLTSVVHSVTIFFEGFVFGVSYLASHLSSK